MSGRKEGNRRSQLWRAAIERALGRKDPARETREHTFKGDYEKGLDRVADKLVTLALEGDQWAMGEIGTRLDGRPAQPVEVSRELGSYDERLLQLLELKNGGEPATSEPDADADGVAQTIN